jgi:NADH:ubiquinone oxidoreductase subunit K
MIPLSWYLTFAALMFCIGLYGVLARKNALAMLLGVELMLNAVNINLLAFWRYLYSGPSAQVFIAIVLAAAAAEAVVGLALIISIYRRRRTVVADELTLMKG